ncbi:unnamed protein product [Microthlaspi erraticum]|uniref:Uncharacterized protein n=1 Tax=Microthlaspi erraticum TaxID=1685480 RepID=A0A6D2JFA5_9BRAS|nr:unnamed protein product [Microthlaspi erraticum]
MDFIKTSSLRALIELTFQRNWNGLIWMSRKGVTTKRVKTVQTALSRTAPNRAVRLAEERCSALGQSVRPSEVSAKVQNRLGRSRITTRETQARGRPRHNRHATPRTITPREPGRTPRGRATRLTTAARPFRLGHDPTVRPIVPTDRPNAAVDPKPVLKPDFIFSSPA